jgi:hypothetical protein
MQSNVDYGKLMVDDVREKHGKAMEVEVLHE